MDIYSFLLFFFVVVARIIFSNECSELPFLKRNRTTFFHRTSDQFMPPNPLALNWKGNKVVTGQRLSVAKDFKFLFQY